ncbi:hypothetical protein GCM10011583_20000 [Streptomyces camponoticapitis]|uniref:Secreted protein n=1 Tax=Streptomyces camponoticapitis TaxID=1616125 RepID=A0ABQ2E3E4_9ACTN|nr:hypothetical protein GCM10011583_20000 [Streptomyces camponoticapitis]
MVRSYGHVGSLVTWVAVVTGVTASTTGGPMINEASGRPVTYHPPGGPLPASLCTSHPALRSPTGSGMLP